MSPEDRAQAFASKLFLTVDQATFKKALIDTMTALIEAAVAEERKATVKFLRGNVGGLAEELANTIETGDHLEKVKR
jgi:hypothetical protein